MAAFIQRQHLLRLENRLYLRHNSWLWHLHEINIWLGFSRCQTALQNEVKCHLCGPGTFSAGAASTCDLCPAGKYQPGSGSAACIECPPLSNSEIGSSSIDECFCTETNYGRRGVCYKCPGHLLWTYCKEPGLELPLPLDGNHCNVPAHNRTAVW